MNRQLRMCGEQGLHLAECSECAELEDEIEKVQECCDDAHEEIDTLNTGKADKKYVDDSIENVNQTIVDVADTLGGRIDNIITSSEPSVTTLWEGVMDSVGDSANLSEDVNDFDYLDIYYRTSVDESEGYYNTVRIPADQFANYTITVGGTMSPLGESPTLKQYLTQLSFVDDTATLDNIREWSWNGSQSSDASDDTQALTGVTIYRIDGVKETGGNAEIADAREGVDGTVYPSLGDAIRGQIQDTRDELEDYAKTDGAYESMTVGNAEQLISSVTVNDKVPYNFRTSGGSIDIGNREVDKLVGGTVAWNQLVNTGMSSVTVTSGHKYRARINSVESIGASTGTAIPLNDATKDNVTDLTQMFGSAIADYIYSLETANAGAGVAWFKKLFPKDYYPYNAGQLMSVKTSAHQMVGFNQWDEQWELGDISGTNGSNIPASRYCRSKNYIPILNMTYYFKIPSRVWVHCYDGDKNYVSMSSAGYRLITTSSSQAFPSNVRYIRFVLGGPTYNHDICINLRWDGERDGDYEAYKKWTYPLDSDLELRGIPKLDSANNLYYDGDTYDSDGTVTRKYGIRAYQSGDESDTSVITDKTNTVYPLQTPTTETADPYQNPQIVDDFGTEEYVDERTVAIPVGHDTEYMNNLKAKLEMAPDSPDGDGDYIVRQTNGENSYVPLMKELPSAPSEDGTYTLKCTVASGVATLGWEREE